MKDVYGDKLEDLRPDFGVLVKEIPFRSAKKTGRDYVEAVQLTHEHGFTYGAGLVTLVDTVPSDVDDAKVRGTALTLRTAFAYDAAANMVAGGKEAFISGTQYKFRTMIESMVYRLEIQMLYGSQNLGTVESASDTDGDEHIVISDATWAPGIWSGAENASIEIRSADLATTRLTASIDKIDSVNKKILFADGTDPVGAGVIATDVVVFAGSVGNEMIGLRTIASNSGTLYGVDGSKYSLWQGNVSSVGNAALTLKKIYDGIVPAVGKGLMEDVCVLVSPATFSGLANDEAGLRRYNTSPKKAENGAEAIQYYGANGKIEIKVHPMVKEGEAIAFPMKRAERLGSTDVTFKTPGRSEEMFLQLPNQTGFECRAYSEQTLFLPCPAKCVLYTGISNS